MRSPTQLIRMSVAAGLVLAVAGCRHPGATRASVTADARWAVVADPAVQPVVEALADTLSAEGRKMADPEALRSTLAETLRADALPVDQVVRLRDGGVEPGQGQRVVAQAGEPFGPMRMEKTLTFVDLDSEPGRQDLVDQLAAWLRQGRAGAPGPPPPPSRPAGESDAQLPASIAVESVNPPGVVVRSDQALPPGSQWFAKDPPEVFTHPISGETRILSAGAVTGLLQVESSEGGRTRARILQGMVRPGQTLEPVGTAP